MSFTEPGKYCLLELNDNGEPAFHDIQTGPVTSFQTEWQGKWNKDILTHSLVRGTEDIPGNYLESLAMSLALLTYGVEIPIKFKKVRSDQNPDIRIEFKSPEEEHQFKERPSVLAFAYFPAQGSVSGRVVFNDAYEWSMDGLPIDNPQTPQTTDRIRTFNLIVVLIHELGHTLGLRHDESLDTEDIMDPIYNANIINLSPNDIIRIRVKYGIRTFKKWSHYARLKNWLNLRVRRF